MTTIINPENQMLFLLERANSMVIGIKKVVVLFYSDHKINLYQRIGNEDITIIESINQRQLNRLTNFRIQQKTSAWFSPSDLPFEIEESKPMQKLMFDELSNVIISLPFKNQFDNHFDFLFLYFSMDAPNFGLSLNNKIMSTETKTAIAHLLQNSFQSQLNLADTYQTALEGQRFAFAKLNEAYNALKNLKHTEVENQVNRVFDFAETIAENYGISQGFYVQFSPEAKSIIENWKGAISDLKNQLHNAIDIAILSRLNSKQNFVVIEDWQLNFEEVDKKSVSKEDVNLSETKYLKTYLLLERMEEAARKLNSKSIALTGLKLGGAMENPISAAAITDSLKKHRTKIQLLCKQFPDRWQLIRAEFKPLQNTLLLKDNFKESISA